MLVPSLPRNRLGEVWSEDEAWAWKESRLQLLGIQFFPYAVVINPKAVVSEASCVFFADIVWFSSLLTLAISPLYIVCKNPSCLMNLLGRSHQLMQDLLGPVLYLPFYQPWSFLMPPCLGPSCLKVPVKIYKSFIEMATRVWLEMILGPALFLRILVGWYCCRVNWILSSRWSTKLIWKFTQGRARYLQRRKLGLLPNSLWLPLRTVPGPICQYTLI